MRNEYIFIFDGMKNHKHVEHCSYLGNVFLDIYLRIYINRGAGASALCVCGRDDREFSVCWQEVRAYEFVFDCRLKCFVLSLRTYEFLEKAILCAFFRDKKFEKFSLSFGRRIII